jgi:hypothetical protein
MATERAHARTRAGARQAGDQGGASRRRWQEAMAGQVCAMLLLPATSVGFPAAAGLLCITAAGEGSSSISFPSSLCMIDRQTPPPSPSNFFQSRRWNVHPRGQAGADA